MSPVFLRHRSSLRLKLVCALLYLHGNFVYANDLMNGVGVIPMVVMEERNEEGKSCGLIEEKLNQSLVSALEFSGARVFQDEPTKSTSAEELTERRRALLAVLLVQTFHKPSVPMCASSIRLSFSQYRADSFKVGDKSHKALAQSVFCDQSSVTVVEKLRLSDVRLWLEDVVPYCFDEIASSARKIR